MLAGDHLQLPPTVISEAAAKKVRGGLFKIAPVPRTVLQNMPESLGDVRAQGLSRTLFERLQGMYGDNISEMLTVQYRMHAHIMQWSSNELYEGRLTAHPSVADHTLSDLPVTASLRLQTVSCRAPVQVVQPCCRCMRLCVCAAAQGVSVGEADSSVLTLIDTAGCGMEEAADEDSDSKRNEGEAQVTLAHARRLVSAGIRPEDIGIITPYNAQVGAEEP